MNTSTGNKLRDTLIAINDNYPSNKYDKSLTSPKKTWFGYDVPMALTSSIDTSGLVVKASAGMGNNAADVPWLGIRNPAFAPSFREGVYLVYLFSTDRLGFGISLNQGVTNVLGKPKSDDYHANEAGIFELRRRRDGLRAILDIPDRFSLSEIKLNPKTPRSRMYEHGHICGIWYPRATVPPEASLISDLLAALNLYSTYDPAMISVADLAAKPDSLPAPERRYEIGKTPKLPSKTPSDVDVVAWQQALERRRTSHQRLLDSVAESAQTAGLHYRETAHIDLVVSRKFIVEAKSINGDAVDQARAALAQLYHYRFTYRLRYLSPELVAVFDKTIPDDLAQFLRDCNVRVFNKSGDSFDSSDADHKVVPWLH